METDSERSDSGFDSRTDGFGRQQLFTGNLRYVMRHIAVGTAQESGTQNPWLTPLENLGEEDVMNASAVKYIVVHCSATPPSVDYTPERLLRDHKARGFRTAGYHFYIRRDGTLTQHRWLLEVGAHCYPYNRHSIGVCYEGGVDSEGRASDTRTKAQRLQLIDLLRRLKNFFPQAEIVGHRDLPGTIPKECPSFNARKAYAFLGD